MVILSIFVCMPNILTTIATATGITRDATAAAGSSKKKRQSTSRKIGCPAMFDVFYMLDNNIKVIHNWIHKNHDSSCIEDLTESKLPVEVKNWIVSHVKRKD